MTENQSISLLSMSERERQKTLEFLQLYQALDREDRAEVRGYASRMLKVPQDFQQIYQELGKDSRAEVREYVYQMLQSPKYQQNRVKKRVGNTLYLNLSGARE